MVETLSRKQVTEFQNSMSYGRQYELVTDFPNVGGAIWSVRKGQHWPERILHPGNYLYVLLPDGEIRIPHLPHTSLDMHHPELAKRNPVIGAGVLGWNSGNVTFIDNKSGCYTPDAFSLAYVKQALQFWGVPLSNNLILDEFEHY